MRNPFRKNNDNSNFHHQEEPQVHFIAVDSRGHSPSNLSCYKQRTCGLEYFQDQVKNNPKFVCVNSQVANLCGLNIQVYFNDHPYDALIHSKLHRYDNYKGEDERLLLGSNATSAPSQFGRINGIATLLTFNPYTGYYNHIVRGVAYVIVGDGQHEGTPLTTGQIMGIVKFIQTSKQVYQKVEGEYYSYEAKMELLTNAYELYVNGTWTSEQPVYMDGILVEEQHQYHTDYVPEIVRAHHHHHQHHGVDPLDAKKTKKPNHHDQHCQETTISMVQTLSHE